ncbi:MAG: 4Fe-4S binding protein [Pseudohongiellaceae bacterium]
MPIPVISYCAYCSRSFQFQAILLVSIALAIFSSQSFGQARLSVTPDILKEVFPEADRFSEKAGTPPVVTAYTMTEEGEQVAGYLFETTDFPPEEVGYSAPIEVLAGIDNSGMLTGIKVLFYRESYKSIRGDFLATERFPNQFEQKSVSDGFRVGRDVDGVSRATITSWAVSRGLRNASRVVAKAYLPAFSAGSAESRESYALQQLATQSWEEFAANGFMERLIVPQEDETRLELSFVFVGHDGLGELVLGVDDYSNADREASSRVSEGSMVVVGISGNTGSPFRQERLAVEQDDQRYQISRSRFVYAGSADQGLIADQVRYAGALVLAPAIDLTRPFRFLYDTSESVGDFESFAVTEYKVHELALALTNGTSLPAEYLPEETAVFDSDISGGVFANLIANAPWPEVIALALILAVVSVAFVSKNDKIRWLALTATLVYLGFLDGGFVSVSHITNGIKLGPAMFLNDLPLLMIISFTVVTTIFWGRVFCSSLCPFGALQDFITKFTPKKIRLSVPQKVHDLALFVKYGILIFLIVMALVYSELSLFQYFEPFGTVFYFSQSPVLWLILAFFLIGSTLIPRFYCRYACPLGAALGVVSLVSPFRIKRVEQCDVCKVCEHSCPTGAIRGPKIDFKECVRCDICEVKLIEQAGVCKHDLATVKSRVKEWQPIRVT